MTDTPAKKKPETPEAKAAEERKKKHDAEKKTLRAAIKVQKKPVTDRTDEEKAQKQPAFTDKDGAATVYPDRVNKAIGTARDEIAKLVDVMTTLAEELDFMAVVAMASGPNVSKLTEYKDASKAKRKLFSAVNKLKGGIDALTEKQTFLNDAVAILLDSSTKISAARSAKKQAKEKEKKAADTAA